MGSKGEDIWRDFIEKIRGERKKKIGFSKVTSVSPLKLNLWLNVEREFEVFFLRKNKMEKIIFKFYAY